MCYRLPPDEIPLRMSTDADAHYPSTRVHVPALLAPVRHYPRCCSAVYSRRMTMERLDNVSTFLAFVINPIGIS
jgi:hypothetical protein